MTPERWARLKGLFHSALECAEPERAAFLESACASDPTLRGEVEALLASHAESGGLMDGAAWQAVPTGPTGNDDAPPLSRVGQRIGPYEVVEEIGHGGMGAVYLAVRADDEYRKVVAIKVVKPGMDTAFVLRRFRQERQVLAGLEHPHIARLLDGGATADGLPYLVMERVDGVPIDRYCTEKSLSLKERLELFRKVCAAVHYAHQNLVVHRDIKPSNILVTPEGEPKLLDFGIAKVLGPEDSGQHTVTGIRLMTPDSAAPEQVRGGAITTAIDVYALGVLLYGLLCGRAPYAGSDGEALARAICESDPHRPSEVAPAGTRRQLAGDLDTIVLKALQKDPQRRYASAEQLAEDVRRHLDGLPVLARPDSVVYRAGKFVRRHAVPVAAAFLLIVSLIAGLGATLWQARVARTERARAERRFNDVRQLANTFLFEIHDGIEKLPGSTPVRANLVKRALEYLDSLSREAAGDAALLSELAAAYARVGNVQGSPFTANLGDTAGAVESYRKESVIREALLARNPSDAKLALDLADNYRRLGLLESERSGGRPAVETVSKALLLAERVDQQDPGPETRRLLATLHNSMGRLRRTAGERGAALDHHRKALASWEALAASDQSDAVLRGIVVSLRDIGFDLMEEGATDEAVAHYRRALEVAETRAARTPDSASVRRELSVAHSSLGNALRKRGDAAEAKRQLLVSLSMDEAALAVDPQNSQAQRDVIWGLSTLADVSSSKGHLEEGMRYLRRGLVLAVRRMEQSPANAQARKDAGDVWSELGRVLAQAGRHDEALAATGRGVGLYEDLVRANPGDSRVKKTLAVACADRAALHARAAARPGGDAASRARLWREARSWFARSLALWQDLERSGAILGVDRQRPGEVAKGLAQSDAALARLGAARP